MATNTLMVSAKSYEAFKADPKKIAGQRILLTTNSTVDYAVRSCLAHWNVDPKSVEFVNLAQAPIITAMIAGQAELGGLWAPNSYSAQEKSGAKVLCSGKTAGVTIPGVLIARADYAKEHPQLVAAYLAVYVHAWQWAKAHPKDAAEMLKAADVEGGVPLSDFGVKEEFTRPTYSLSEELELMKKGSGASKLETWMDEIGAFLEKVGLDSKGTGSEDVRDRYLHEDGRVPTRSCARSQTETTERRHNKAGGVTPSRQSFEIKHADDPQMATTYLKKAAKTALSESGAAREVAERMLAKIAEQREDAVRAYARELDGWSGPILVTPDEIERRSAEVPEQVKADIW